MKSGWPMNRKNRKGWGGGGEEKKKGWVPELMVPIFYLSAQLASTTYHLVKTDDINMHIHRPLELTNEE